VKCYKLLINCLLVLYSSILFGNEVIPIDVVEITNGEIYRVKILSELTDDELEKFKNQKINKIMYVTDVIIDRNREFEVFITNPDVKKESSEEEKDVFSWEQFQFKPTQKDINSDLFAFQKNYKIDKKNIMTLIVFSFVAFIVVFIIIYLFKKYLRKKREKILRKEKINKLQSLVLSAFKRIDFELIYNSREEILKYKLYNEDKFNNLLNAINDIQYKKEWTDAELNELVNCKKLLRSRDGI